MTKKSKNKNEERNSESKYDIPRILMDYVMSTLPGFDPDDPEDLSEDEMLDILDNTFQMCIFAWNYAVLPDDCGEKIMATMKESFEEEEEENMEEWEHAKEIVLEIVEDIRAEYPNADEIVVDHELELTEEGDLNVNVEIMALEDAVAEMREAE